MLMDISIIVYISYFNFLNILRAHLFRSMFHQPLLRIPHTKHLESLQLSIYSTAETFVDENLIRSNSSTYTDKNLYELTTLVLIILINLIYSKSSYTTSYTNKTTSTPLNNIIFILTILLFTSFYYRI